MSASKSKSDLFHPISVQTSATLVNVTPSSFRIRKNGIEFATDREIPLWTEMTVELEIPGTRSFMCTGVVVAAGGNRHAGFKVVLLFTGLTEAAQQRLNDFSSVAAISVRV
jgi:hypothetical protein